MKKMNRLVLPEMLLLQHITQQANVISLFDTKRENEKSFAPTFTNPFNSEIKALGNE